MDRKAEVIGLNSLLAAHFAPLALDELVVTRRAVQAMLERGGDEALEARDIDSALADMLGAGGRLGARMLGAEPAMGFADVA